MRKKKSLIGQSALNLIFIVLCLLIVCPFVLVVSISLSNEADIIANGYKFIPENLDWAAYKYVFKNPITVLDAYKVTIIYSVIAMVLAVILMACLAFVLSKPKLRGKRYLSFYLFFTMLFSGGMVPSYILITRYLHLDDTIWVYILPGLISPWYVFMIRTFFQGVPYELTEAAIVDGASQYRILFGIIIPVSKPVLATVALFTFLIKWNDWMTSMMYINSRTELISLQYLLQRIMQNIELLKSEEVMSMGIDLSEEIPSETVRMAMAVVVAGPALVVFPFFQKYFVKGLTIGSVKG